MGLCMSRKSVLKDDLYLLVEQWLPEYIDHYGDIDSKYYCPFGIFLGGFVEYIVIVKKYPLSETLRMHLDVLKSMVLEVLGVMYPEIMSVKGGNKIETCYMTGIRMKMLP